MLVGNGKKEEGRGKKEEGRGKREEIQKIIRISLLCCHQSLVQSCDIAMSNN
ncbi:hypothetical protein QUB60_08945 [Microcoleus sp. A2-C5]|uniref:hypothetical protein n=1 Tax=Microcoleaceae TaxID=1892252 RepID=UPI0022389067|nr:hypothetical protein [Lyngbya sp. CCAP 1446/10]